MDPDTKSSIAGIVAASGGEFDDNSGDFDILFQAVQSAGLVDALNDPDAELTAFAPTDGAFISLAQSIGFEGDDEAGACNFIVEALTALGGGDPIPVLTDVLTYHVSAGAQTLEDVVAQGSVTTLLGADFTLDAEGNLEDLDPDAANPGLVATDVEASNGIVHVIDGVLRPTDLPDVPQPDVVSQTEDWHLGGYKVEHSDVADGGALIKLDSHIGVAQTDFEGESGTYDIAINAFDEQDGQGELELWVNDTLVLEHFLDEDLPGFVATEENAVTLTVSGIELEEGDQLTLIGQFEHQEFVRVDSVEFTQVTPAAEPVASEQVAATESLDF